MGIEIPPPKGGPAVFTTSSPGNQSPVSLSPNEERLGSPEIGDDMNDGGSVCLSEGEAADTVRTSTHPVYEPHVSALMRCFSNLDGTIDSQHRDGEDGNDMSIAVPMANNVVLYCFFFTVEPRSFSY